MRCRKNDFVEGAMFHIYNYSVAEISLFREPEDYFYYIRKLIEFTEDSPIKICAFSLIPNRFDFCVQQSTEFEVYRLFNRIGTSYALHYNRKYGRKGKLFAGKLQHRRIKSDSQMITLCQIIHYKPVKEGIVKDVREWPYTNYFEYAQLRNGSLFSREMILDFPDIFKDYSKTLSDFEARYKEIVFQR